MWPPEVRAPTQGRPYGSQREPGIFIGDTEGTEISQRHQGSPCIFVYSYENSSSPCNR